MRAAPRTTTARHSPTTHPRFPHPPAGIRPFTGEGGSPIYVAADGIVFDMSSHETGPAFYGPGGGYHAFAGRDASIGLATMEVSPDKCVKRTVDELSSAERETLGDWVQRFSMKYRIVGYLNDGAHPRTVAAGQAAAGGGR